LKAPVQAPPDTVSASGKFEDVPVRRSPAPTTPGGGTAEGTNSGGYDFPRVAGALAAVIGLILLLRWLGKRFFSLPTAQRTSRVVQVLSRSVLSPKQHLVLVRVGQRVLVAADNGSQMSRLSEITDPDEVASLLGQLQSEKEGSAFGLASAKAFNSVFGRLKKTNDSEGADNEPLGDAGHPAMDDDDISHESAEQADLEDPEFAASLLSSPVTVSNDNVVAATRHELNGLMEKVRLVSDQFGKTA
jgi:flagellar biogenesis protein FliO